MDGPAEPSAGRHLGLALLVAGAFFMENLDGTIIATAAPDMARAFGVASADIGITMTAYLVTVGAVIPVSGWVSDRWGPRRTFAVAIAVFTVASVLCAASTSLVELTVMRVLQGAAGALMVPVGRLVVLRSTAKQDLITVIAVLTWPALVAPIIAPVLAGLFTTYLSWHWIFLVNLPLGVIALVAALIVVPDTGERAHSPLDGVGLGLSAAALVPLLYAASLFGQRRIPWLLGSVLVAVGALAATAGIRHLRRTGHPLVDLAPLRIQTFRVPHAGGALFRTSVFAVPFLLPLMFQDAFGWSPLRAGVMVLFVFAGNLAVKPATTGLLRRFGFRTVLLTATTAAAATMLATALVGAGTPDAVIASLLVVGGAFRSIGFTGYNTLAFADVPPAQMVHANTLASTLQTLAQGLGVAVGALALRAGTALVGPSPTAAYHTAFVVIGVLTLIAALEVARLPRDTGAVLIS